ncbi:hypothetical protein ACFX1S_040242 [Malus domestica]
MAAEGAFKHVKAAWDVLSDPAKREAYDKSLRQRFQAAHGSNKRRASECKPAQPQRSSAFPRKRSSPGGDGSCYKKTIKIIRKSNPGQKATVMMVSVRRVAKCAPRFVINLPPWNFGVLTVVYVLFIQYNFVQLIKF